MASGMNAFASSLQTVASKVLTAKKFIHNIAQYNNYESLYYLLMRRSMREMVRAGSDVRERVAFATSSKASGTDGWYDAANEDHAPSNGQDGSWIIDYWHPHMVHESWKEEELLVNSGGLTEGSLAEETQAQALLQKLQSLQTKLMNSLSDSFWAVPNPTTMEGPNSTRPKSIPVYLNVGTSGLFNPGSSGTAFTTIHGVDPANAAYAAYRPFQGTYANFTVNDAGNPIRTFAKAMRRTAFKPAPIGKEYFVNEDDGDMAGDNGVIFCSEDGVSRVEFLYAASQDRWPSFMDPAGNPRYKNTQLVYESRLDDAPLYPLSTTGLASESGATITGPRYYGVNGRYLKVVFHIARFLEFLDPLRTSLTGWQQGVNSLATVICADRSKHWFVSPSTSV